MKQQRQKPLVLVVGRRTPLRQTIAQELLQDGCAVVVCGGPPGCALLHEDGCALTAGADATVILHDWVHPAGTYPLEACASSARRAVFVRPPPFPLPPDAIVADGEEPEAIVHAVRRAAGVAAA